jgi:hypothetical protein
MIVPDFTKMLIAVSSIGIYITQEDGHRYINVDVRELSHWRPEALHHADFLECPDPESENPDPIFVVKHYGSYLTALHRIESWLPCSLISIYNNLNYADTITGMENVE